MRCGRGWFFMDLLLLVGDVIGVGSDGSKGKLESSRPRLAGWLAAAPAGRESGGRANGISRGRLARTGASPLCLPYHHFFSPSLELVHQSSWHRCKHQAAAQSCTPLLIRSSPLLSPHAASTLPASQTGPASHPSPAQQSLRHSSSDMSLSRRASSSSATTSTTIRTRDSISERRASKL